MKRILLTSIALIAIAITSFGQAPEGFNYQAVIRDASNAVLSNQPVGVQLTIKQGSIDGPAVYMESFTASSNAFGLVNLEIGRGITTDDFSEIDWKDGPYFIETGIDASGGTSYSVMGTSELMSVPFALHAKTAGNAFSGDYHDLSNQPVIPTSTSDMINDSGFITDSDDADADPSNEIQDLQLVDNILSITNNGTATTIDLSAYLVDTDTQLTESEVDDFVSNNGYITDADDADADPVNEIQDLQLIDNILTITNNGTATTIDLSSYLVDTDTQLTEAEVDDFVSNNGYITDADDADADPENEIQDLQLVGHDLTITNNGSATEVDLSWYLDNTDTQLTESEVDAFVANNGYMDNTDEQTLSLVGNTLTIENGNSVTLVSGPVEVITDADEDTKIQVEEIADEDVIRFDIAGTEKWRMTGSTMEAMNSGNSVFIGEGAGIHDDLSTNNNVFIGKQAGASNDIGRDNVAIGYQAQYSSIGNSWENTAVGNQALYSNTTQGNTAVGSKALRDNTTGYQNVAVGANALSRNTTATGNTALGADALYFNTTGYANTATGTNALIFNTTGFQNTANGYNAMQRNSTGGYNSAFGVRSLFNNTSGLQNTSMGYNSMEDNTSGRENSAYGYGALANNTVAQKNTAIGVFALYSTTTGQQNVAIGHSSGGNNATGNENVYIGYGAGAAVDGLSYATAIGARASVSASNMVQIGDNHVTDVQLGTGSNVTLETGLVKITGGDPDDGKVLTSDADGNATWQVSAPSGTTVLTAASATPVTANNYDVTGVGVLFITPTTSSIDIHGLQGGVTGQVVHIVSTPDAGTTCCVGIYLQDNNAGGIQKFKRSGGYSIGWEQATSVVFDGTYWRVLDTSY